MVNQLSFQGPPEVTQSDQVMNPLEFKVQLTAFYMPTLTDLEAESPSINAPPSSKKHNPLSPYIKDGNDE
jgi:type IV pilus assembly protein PilO